MYINEIFSILNEILDNIFTIWIEGNNKKLLSFKKIIEEKNFKKFQKEINEIIDIFFTLINQEKINELVKKNSNIELINAYLERYVCYYIFLFIGMMYSHDLKDFNNNLIEISKEQLNYNLVVSGFFNSESNSLIIKNLLLLKDLNNYFTKKKMTDLINKFIIDNEIENFEKHESYFKDKNLAMRYNNLIKYIINYNIFNKEEKKNLFNEIEISETTTGEFTFIDIVVSKSHYIELEFIEDILPENKQGKGYSNLIFNFINEDEINEIENFYNFNLNYDIKIQKLFETGLIVPIVDDFMLYHKENIKYIKDDENVKTKDETKIKFVVNKINNVMNYYKNKNEIQKLFYQPLIEKKYVLINFYENLKITENAEKIINLNNNNLVYLDELNEFSEYPFLSYKDYDKTFIIFNANKNIEAIRKTSFSNNKIQTRIITNDMFVNVVGFSLVDEIQNINNSKTSKFNKFDNHNITNNIKNDLKSKIDNKLFFKNNKKTYNYTLFDLEKQKYTINDTNIKSNNNDKMKYILMSIYDYINNLILNRFKEWMLLTNNQNIIKNIELLNTLGRKYKDLINNDYSKKYDELLYYIYYVKSLKINKFEDDNEYIFKGMDEANIKLLPMIDNKYKKHSNSVTFSTSTIKKKKLITEDSNKLTLNVICQHTLSWSILNKKDQNSIYKFINQYAFRNKKDIYTCKSCGSILDLQKFILETKYKVDEMTTKFEEVIYSGVLEEIYGYEKYDLSIKNLRKIIERMANVFNLTELMGSNYNSKIKIKIVLKNVIDMLIYQKKEYDDNEYLKKRPNLIKSYGIVKELSDFFVFNLENSIFVKSSKETLDYMKISKYNNIICYVILNLIINISENEIYTLKNDKICNFNNFMVIYKKLFGEIKIIKNDNKDLIFITEFPVLCYLLFSISCFIIKYNLWGVKVESKEFGITQIKIINTTIEILNSILSMDVKKSLDSNIYLYEIFINKYYKKMSMFNNKTIMTMLKNANSEKINGEKFLSVNNENKFVITKDNLKKTNVEYEDLYTEFVKPNKLVLYEPKKKYKNEDFYKNTNLSNCENGFYHDFKNKNKKLICKNCDVELNNKLFDNKKTEIVNKNYDILYLTNLTTKYCIDGNFHLFKNNVCKLCNYEKFKKYEYKLNDLLKMHKIIENIKLTNNLKTIEMCKNIQENIVDETKNINKVINKILYKFQKYDNNLTNSVDILLNKIQEVMGKDIVINKNMYNIFNDIYVLTHDFDGTKFENPLKIMDENNKIKIIENHSKYKTDVISVIVEKNVKYEAVFDLKTLLLLGYKKQEKDFVDAGYLKCKIDIYYSIKTIFTYFGFTRLNLYKEDFNVENMTMDDFIQKCGSYRFYSIKKYGYYLKKYIYRYKNNYVPSLVSSKEFFNKELITVFNDKNNDKLDLLYNTNNKIKDIVVEERDKNLHIFMKYYKDIYNCIHYTKIKEKNNGNKLNNNFILTNDFSSNIILNYIIDEIVRIINYNTNKNNKQNILIFILSLTIEQFNKYNLTMNLQLTNNFKQIIYNYTELTHYTLKAYEDVYDDNLKDAYGDDLIDENTTDEEKKEIMLELQEQEEIDNALDIDDEDMEDDREVEDYEME